MRTVIVSVLSGLGLLVSTVAFADDAASGVAGQSVQAVPVSDSSNPIVCHTLVHDGQLLHRSECLRQSEWNRVRHESEQAITEWQQRALQMPTTPQ